MLSKAEKNNILMKTDDQLKENNYCLDHKNFFDNNEICTQFWDYYIKDNEKITDVLDLIKNKDVDCRIYVQIYNIEEDVIYSDTLIIKTNLDIEFIENCFETINLKYNEYISPSTIHILNSDIEKYVYIDNNGNEIKNFIKDSSRIICLWWD